MLEMLLQWYRRRFTDPQAIALLAILVAGFCILYFLHGILTRCWSRLCWPICWSGDRASAAHRLFPQLGGEPDAAGVCRYRHAAGVRGAPTAWQQGMNLMTDLPGMVNQFYNFAATLPKRYPALVDAGIIDMMAENLRSRLSGVGESVVKFSLASLVGLLTLAIYLILVPMMMFFLLKDKEQLLNGVRASCRATAAGRPGVGGDEPADHQLYPRQGAGDGDRRRGDLSGVPGAGMRYSLLLAVLVGFSVLIPYIARCWSPFRWWWWRCSSGRRRGFLDADYRLSGGAGLDGNLLVPILFSEAVNLHPLLIILSVIIFGGLWGSGGYSSPSRWRPW
ncbi:Domain of uncharacterised function DUF20 [Serratia rubidaea]|uniref:Domain of uncharacterized function DUF20 n=1 Tax=Serratia rubidaea TaxID=61652 RepID=A0A447QHD0_SERRU|nr:Domain of uncharacterised function DUF20 [Serratia rubidaea]